ncbi:hypothetical protein [Halorussus sp. MSC15.2]|uniref:hypothetical protein n=1 Tax=Halorussus sp. MSC15.2 TaxID=2283638 RepID=UPI0013D7C174|nr:hypothetical protein [Halorussus sp. MSC15.2]NEU58045.1 hypothetical protein [Halorussus sp. MSC15.2]
MEPWPRRLNKMDLREITSGLRGGDERTRRDDESGVTAGPECEDDSRSTTSESCDATPNRSETTSDDSASAERDRSGDHLCPFCETEFDADRGACPECDAEIVLRGTR